MKSKVLTYKLVCFMRNYRSLLVKLGENTIEYLLSMVFDTLVLFHFTLEVLLDLRCDFIIGEDLAVAYYLFTTYFKALFNVTDDCLKTNHLLLDILGWDALADFSLGLNGVLGSDLAAIFSLLINFCQSLFGLYCNL